MTETHQSTRGEIPRRYTAQTQEVWCVVETTGGNASVVAVKTNDGAANIADRVIRARWPKADAWRVRVTGPHAVSSDYI